MSDRLKAIYTASPNEKMTDAKQIYILRLIVPLAVYFDNVAQGVPKLKTAEQVAKGCFLQTRSILKWGNEFCSEVTKRRTTSQITQPDGTIKGNLICDANTFITICEMIYFAKQASTSTQLQPAIA